MNPSQPSLWRRVLRKLGSQAPAPQRPAAPAGHGAPPGPRIGRFLVQRLLSQGAASALCAAIDPDTGACVALKLIDLGSPEEPAARADAAGRFLQEARVAVGLQHPHIVAVHEVGIVEGRGLVVMELLPGTDLERYTHPGRLLPEPAVLDIAAKLAGALAYAHEAGVIHRDVKPANVMLDLPRGQVKLTDFGIARVMDGTRSRSGVMQGTPLFMAPEQLAGGLVDGRADLYALGVLLYQLLSARLPYEAASMGELLRRVTRGERTELSVWRPDLPTPLLDLVRSLLQLDAQARPDDGDSVAAALRAIAAAHWTGSTPAPLPPTPQSEAGERDVPRHNASPP
jgi:eukaryotic-like serine/threonine-protein kinase